MASIRASTLWGRIVNICIQDAQHVVQRQSVETCLEQLREAYPPGVDHEVPIPELARVMGDADGYIPAVVQEVVLLSTGVSQQAAVCAASFRLAGLVVSASGNRDNSCQRVIQPCCTALSVCASSGVGDGSMQVVEQL